MVKAKKQGKVYTKPVWLKLSEEEVKKLLVQLSEKYSPAQIGLILRDQYGVPTTKVYGKKMNEYLKEAGKETDFEQKNIEKKLEKMKDHLKNNITDKATKHKIQRVQSQYNAMKKYSEKNN